MKRILFTALLSIALITSCKKTDNTNNCNSTVPAVNVPSSETAYLQNFLSANSITATEKNGMFYTLTQGSGNSPNVCNTVSAEYVGNLINGTTVGAQFDASQAGQPASFKLLKLISSWQIIFPLVKVGGTVTMYVPPSLGYGSNAAGAIPANSYLKFVVTLRDVR